MSKAVLISIRPEWCEKIINGQKTIEVRKTRPKIDTPFRCYIYETHHAIRNKWLNVDNPYKRVSFARGRGQVIGEFVCDGVLSHCESSNADLAEQQGCIRREKLFEYSQGRELYGWHISDLVIYDKPLDICTFRKWCNENCKLCVLDYTHCPNSIPLDRPPQSWCYVQERYFI